MRKLKLVGARLVESPNWKEGIPLNSNLKKKLSQVVFSDRVGNFYEWFPLKDELNKLVNNFISADERNKTNLANPESRSDIIELKKLQKQM